MSPKNKKRLQTFGVLLTGCAGALAVAGGATRFVSKAVGIVDSHYVVRDSFVAYQAGQALIIREKAAADARRDSLLTRVDHRVAAMYCGSLPLNKRAGCE